MESCEECGREIEETANGRCYHCAPVTASEEADMLAYSMDPEHETECDYCGGCYPRRKLAAHRLTCRKRRPVRLVGGALWA